MGEIDRGEIASTSREFISTVCKVCGICDREKGLQPDLCETFYEADPPRFINNVIHKVCMLRESDREKYRKLGTFEGFCALFCHEEVCPAFEKECEVNLTKKVSCYELFLYQSSSRPALKETSRIYSVWSGIDPPLISESFKLFSSLAHIPKKRKKQIAKTLKKLKKVAIKGQRKYHGRSKHSRKKNKKEELVNTLFFYNNSLEWEEKLSNYLDGTNNQRQNKAASHTG